ncbi:MAG: peptide ABC transporter substrate-binding protein [Candidatus Eremiobacteraeota bacterium]|nr:peptide ABC transporter substrate-binding protein [Candidatus Eremiobacteraeota bacterium]
MKRILVLLLALSTTLGLPACTQVSTSNDSSARNGVQSLRNNSTQPGIVRYALGSDINTLNPIITTLAVEQNVAGAIFDGLVEINDQQRLIPDLATVVPTLRNGGISRDGKTITYHLRHGVVWHDGKPFTADDVIFTIRTILDPRVNAPNTAIYEQVRAISAPDPYTVVVQLKSPSAPAVAQLFCNGENGEIIPRHLLKNSSDFNRDPFAVKPVGTGPMEMDRWEHGSRLVLKPNPHYFRGAPHIQQLQILFISDHNTRLTMLSAKELDVGVIPLATQLPTLRSITGYTVSLVSGYTGVHATFNVTRTPFDDVRVRQALVLALDRKRFVANTYGESGVPADSTLPPYNWAYTSDNHSLPYDVRRANALLDQAGWKLGSDGTRTRSGRRLQFSLLTYAGATARAILAQQMQSAWHAVGADVTVRPIPINVLFARDSMYNKAEFDVALDGFVYDPDPDRSVNFGTKYFSPIGSNTARFSDPEIDALSARGLALHDPRQRRSIYARLQQRLNELVPVIPIAWPKAIYVVNNDLHGFKPEPVNSDFWNVQEWRI